MITHSRGRNAMGRKTDRNPFHRFVQRSGHTSEANLAELIVAARDRGISPTIDDVWSIPAPARMHQDGEWVWPKMLSTFLSAYASQSGFASALDPRARLGTPLLALGERGPPRAVALCRRRELLDAAKVLDHHGNVNWLLGDLGDNLRVEERFDLIVCAPPIDATDRKEIFAGVSRPVRDSRGHLLLLRSCRRALSDDGIGIFLVSSRFLFLRRKDGVRKRLSDFGLSLTAYLSAPPRSWGFGPRAGVAFIRKGVSHRIFAGIFSEDEERNHTLLRNLLSMTDGGSVSAGRLVATRDFVSPETLASAERIGRLGIRLGMEPQRLGDIAQEIKAVGRGGPSILEERSDAFYLPLIPSLRAVTEAGQLKAKVRDWVQVVLDEDKADPRYVASFLNSPAGRMIREAGIVAQGTLQRLPPRGVPDLVLFLPDKTTQARVVETDSRAASLINEVRELREQLWERPLAETRVRENLEGVNRDESFPSWLDTLPFPLASILWAYHAAEGDDRAQYEHLDHFFEALSAFLATLALSAFWTDRALVEREWPSIRNTLDNHSLSLQAASMGTWVTITERLFKRARQMLGGEEIAECLQAFRTEDRTILAALLGKSLVSTLKRANANRNTWRGHGGIVGGKKAYELRVKLFAYLNEVRECFGTVWMRYQLVRAGEMRMLDDGAYKTRVESVMGRSYPFPSRTVELEEPLRYGQLYLLGETEPRALPLLPFVALLPSPDDIHNACYFFNRAKEREIRLVSYHFETKPELLGEFRDTRRILNELAQI